MKNPLKKSKTELNLTNAGELMAAGAAAGMAIAAFAGKKGNIGGIIGAGFTLLIGGLIVAMDDSEPTRKYRD
jgi:thiamine pyrophosphate-dependent acetolactate synthase large subunit-like protein